jgi:sugar O-acyltransferase (sialic acid O-acetyltransferase NeuD family)
VRALLIAGAGGLGRETAEAVRAINAVEPTWKLLGFLDDSEALHGSEVSGLPVLGDLASLHDHPDAQLVLAIASPTRPSVRHTVAERLGLSPERYATLVHPGAHLAATATLGAGSIVLAGVVMTADVSVGDHAVVMPGCVFTHDNEIGDCVTFGAGVCVSGGVSIKSCAYVGAGALIREGVVVGRGSTVGLGSVVLRDIPDNEVWVGAPAKRLRAGAGER